MNAEIVKAWTDATHAHIALAVDEIEEHGEEMAKAYGFAEAGVIPVRVEYTASVPLSDLDGLSEKERANVLIEAVKMKRASLRNEQTDLGMSGKRIAI